VKGVARAATAALASAGAATTAVAARGAKLADAVDVRSQLRYVLFPDSTFIKYWDMLMLLNLFLLSFYLPYSIGVSAGYIYTQDIVWGAFMVLFNAIFFVDTWLPFFRAYHDKRGRLVFDHRRIACNYARGLFIPNLLSVVPVTLPMIVIVRQYQAAAAAGRDPYNSGASALAFVKVFNVLKFVRLARGAYRTAQPVRRRGALLWFGWFG
jgi:hypothetical protein